jgi:succinoglycan biosynthesis transport protein ExoP
MTNEPRYSTLRDYLLLLRRQRLVVAAVTVVFALAGLGLALSESKTYTANADVTFRDISQDLRYIGVNTAPALAPSQLAEVSAQTVTLPAAAQRVRHQLKRTHLSATELQDAVTTHVETLTSQVVIQAEWSDPTLAAKIANAFADQAVATAERQQSKQIDAAIADLKHRLPKKPTPAALLTPAESIAEQQLQTLQTTKTLARPAEISRRAQPPASASSPNPARNALVGAIVGLALGLLAAFIRDSLDRRIRGSKDAQEELGYPVLGRVGATALGTMGLASNGRVPLSAADVESFRVLRTNLAFFDPKRSLRSVLVTSGLPEEGKTTVAASLAAAAAAAGQRTLLVEGDLRRPAIASRLGLKRSPGLAEYLAGTSTPAEILQTHPIGLGPDAPERQRNQPDSAPHSTLICIAAGSPPAQPAELLASERCKDFLEKIAKAYDLVVIDSSPLLSSADPLELVPYVEGVIVCVRLSRTTRDEARAVRGALGRLPKRPTGVVVTGLRGGQEDYGYYGYEPQS